ncbi:MAG: hypothetical protein PUP91_18525 [Rhizonema sp. PD37]|nr:hypothetical protein [Rhizonema sp. PD37]
MPSSAVGTLAGSFSELVMAISLLLTEERTQFFLVTQGGTTFGDKTGYGSEKCAV